MWAIAFSMMTKLICAIWIQWTQLDSSIFCAMDCRFVGFVLGCGLAERAAVWRILPLTELCAVAMKLVEIITMIVLFSQEDTANHQSLNVANWYCPWGEILVGKDEWWMRFIRKKDGRRCLAVPAINELPALSCCTLQQNTLEFLHPPSRHRQHTMVTSICFCFKVILQCSEAKRQHSQAACMGSPPATPLILGKVESRTWV